MRLIAIVLSLVASAALAFEQPLAPVSLVPAAYAQTPLDIAANGSDFLALWADSRSTLDLDSLELAHGLLATRLNVAGTPAEPAGRRIFFFAYGAKLAPSGAGYLLVYGDGSAVFSVPIDANGGENGTPKQVGTGFTPMALATNGTNFLLLRSLGVSILGGDGALVRTTPIADMVDNSPIWVLPNGSYQFVVFRYECNGVTACLETATLTTVTPAGDVSESRLFSIPQGSHVAAAYGNGRVLVANQSIANGQSYVEARLFDTTGAPLHGAVQIAAEPQPPCCPANMPAVGWDGTEFLVVWQWADLRAARVTADDVLLDAAPIVLDPANATPPRFASNGVTTTLIWGSGNYLTYDLLARTVRSFDELGATSSHVIADSASLERGVQLATGPSGVLAVWREGFPNPSIVGAVAGRNPVTIAPAQALDLQAPAAARGRDAFLVVWREQSQDAYRIVARRVSFDGVPIDTAPIVVAADNGGSLYGVNMPTISVASDGDEWLIAYAGNDLAVHAVRVGALGNVLDAAPLRLSLPLPHFGISASPHVVWSGSQYVAVWAEDLSNPFIIALSPPNSAIYVARVTAAGQLVDTQDIWHGGLVPDVALVLGPARLFAAWTDEVSLHSMILGSDGTPLTSDRVLASVKPAFPTPLPDVEAAWDGATFVAAWTVRTSNDDAHIEVEHLDVNGVPVEASPLERSGYTPALAPTDNGVAVAFHAIADTYVARAFETTLPRLDVPPRRRPTR